MASSGVAALGPALLAPISRPVASRRKTRQVIGMLLRGVRGATTVTANSREAIIEATKELLAAMLEANDIIQENVASAFFTTTADLTAEFPAVAAREMGWSEVALLCGHEMNVPGSLPMCLRILLHVNTEKRGNEIVHVYLRGATVLRPEFQGPQ